MFKEEKINLPVRPHILISLFLVAVIYIVYRQAGEFGFFYLDDHAYITENLHVRAGLTSKSIAWAFTSVYAANWHPITWISHMLDIQLYGLHAGSHHFTNLIFHMANTLLVFQVFRKMTGMLWQSAFVSILFALHPLHVESVVWIAERKDVLCAFFGLLTILNYHWYVKQPGILRYFFVLVVFTMGLMAKPMLVTLPFVLLLMDYWPFERLKPVNSNNDKKSFQWSRYQYILWEKFPLFFLSIISSIITIMAQKAGEAIRNLSQFSISTRIENALAAYVKYIVKMLWPHNLAVLYPHSVITLWQVSFALFFLILISYFVFRYARGRPYLIVGWLWYLGTMFPVIGLIQVGMQAMADRYTYIPLIGLYIMLGWGVPELFVKWRHMKIALSISVSLVVIFIMIRTYTQVRHWKNSITLFQHTIEATDKNYIIHFYMAEALTEHGRHEDAVKHYMEALQIKPDCAEAHNGLGVVLNRRGESNLAIKHLQQAIYIYPLYAEAYNNLGNTLVQFGRTDEAIQYYKKSISLVSDKPNVYNNLGLALIRQGKINQAVFQFKQALKIDPQNTVGHRNLKRVMAFQEKLAKAAENLERALDVNSGTLDDGRLDQIIKKRNELNEVVEQLKSALKTQPGFNPEEFDIKNLSNVYQIYDKYNRLIP